LEAISILKETDGGRGIDEIHMAEGRFSGGLLWIRWWKFQFCVRWRFAAVG